MMRLSVVAACLAFLTVAQAQQEQTPIGTVATRDALVAGGLQVQGDQAKLLTNVSVTAYDRTAPIALMRGGDVLVCSTSRFHLQRSSESSLVFALDRGAIEIHSDSQPQDVVITPDLRMTFVSTGRLDLRMRVTSNGDTCVENTGKSAPEIAVSDAFSDSSYHLRPGQHVLFEHGSVREVVDQETSSCGCPPPLAPVLSATQTGGEPADVAARNPFPAAVSQGLAPETKPVSSPASAGAKSQVAPDLTLSNTAAAEPETPVAATTTAPTPTAPSAPPPAPPGANDIAHALSRFFHRLFHGDSDKQKH